MLSGWANESRSSWKPRIEDVPVAVSLRLQDEPETLLSQDSDPVCVGSADGERRHRNQDDCSGVAGPIDNRLEVVRNRTFSEIIGIIDNDQHRCLI